MARGVLAQVDVGVLVLWGLASVTSVAAVCCCGIGCECDAVRAMAVLALLHWGLARVAPADVWRCCGCVVNRLMVLWFMVLWFGALGSVCRPSRYRLIFVLLLTDSSVLPIDQP